MEVNAGSAVETAQASGRSPALLMASCLKGHQGKREKMISGIVANRT
jgi:hypothetical protein